MKKTGRLINSIINYAKSEFLNYYFKQDKLVDLRSMQLSIEKDKIYVMYRYIYINKTNTRHIDCLKLGYFDKKTRYMYFQNDFQKKPSPDNLRCKIKSSTKFRIENY